MPTAPNRPPRNALARLRRSEPGLAAALDRAPFPGFPESAAARAHTHYSYLARAIVFQQLTGKAAGTIFRRAVALTPGPRFPRPDELLALPDATLASAGLSTQKVRALRDLAARVDDGRLVLAGIARRDDDEIIERLVTVRGIGVWSAQMFLLFRLGRLDVMPTGDLGVQEGLRRLDGLDQRPTPAEVAARGEAWAPLRSVAAWALWRLTED